MASIINESWTTTNEWYQSRILNKFTCGQIVRFNFPPEQEAGPQVPLKAYIFFHFYPHMTLRHAFICFHPYW